MKILCLTFLYVFGVPIAKIKNWLVFHPTKFNLFLFHMNRRQTKSSDKSSHLDFDSLIVTKDVHCFRIQVIHY
jgi:hypothetical protein